MSSRRSAAARLAALFIFGGLLSRVPDLAACEAIPNVLSAQKPPKLRVEPLRSPKNAEDPLKPVLVLLREYLSRTSAKKETTVSVDVVQDGKTSYRAAAIVGERRFEAPFEFPGSLNQALTGLVESLSEEVKSPLKTKKILPFLNETPSATAYLRYADGALALDATKSLTPHDLERAARAFEDAVKADYNYVFAYAGLGEALAAWSALETGERAKTLRAQALAEMQKAKLLNPYRAKTREDRMNWYLKKARCEASR
ncbi:MAG TPA: hypothetical protein VFX30_00900 [bacterium]|nr:hypothetical protein [bacterium]